MPFLWYHGQTVSSGLITVDWENVWRDAVGTIHRPFLQAVLNLFKNAVDNATTGDAINATNATNAIPRLPRPTVSGPFPVPPYVTAPPDLSAPPGLEGKAGGKAREAREASKEGVGGVGGGGDGGGRRDDGAPRSLRKFVPAQQQQLKGGGKEGEGKEGKDGESEAVNIHARRALLAAAIAGGKRGKDRGGGSDSGGGSGEGGALLIPS